LGGFTYGLKIVAAVLIVIVGRLVALGIKKLLRKIMVRSKVDEMLVSFTTNLGYVTMLAFVIIAALGQLGIQTTSFVAIVGAAGLAIGLALQGSLSNFAAGVLMIISIPFPQQDVHLYKSE